jgi:hypothetical protein
MTDELRAASAVLPPALVHFGERVAADTVLAVRRRDWRALLFLGVLAIVLLQVATLVLRWRAGLLPAPRPRPLPHVPTRRRGGVWPRAGTRLTDPWALTRLDAQPTLPSRCYIAKIRSFQLFGLLPHSALERRKHLLAAVVSQIDDEPRVKASIYAVRGSAFRDNNRGGWQSV